MTDIVYLKKDDAFTDSECIAEASGIKRHAIQNIVTKYQKDFEGYGKLAFEMRPLESGQKVKVYLFNEQQATLLLTYLKNTEQVREFKKALVSQFYKMRQFILERHTEEWQASRKQGKLTRKSETDVIKQLVEYAKEQGSTHSEMLYMTYSKLANSICGIKSREEATVSQLNNLSIYENIILQMIRNGIEEGLNYKEIYKICKSRCNEAKRVAMI